MTKNEVEKINNIKDKIQKLEMCINTNDYMQYDQLELMKFLESFKEIIGNFNNDLSTLSCLAAKQYLLKNHKIKGAFNILDKAQGAPGLDIDEHTVNNERIIGEIKTTVPYRDNDFGSKQKESIQVDIKKLLKNEATYKYFFVTNYKTYSILLKKYDLETIKVVYIGSE